MKKRTLRRWAALVFAIACALAPLSVSAQQGSTTQYIYDDNGRLHVVLLPTGEAAIYEYDAAGNLTAIRRTAADALVLFSFTPHEGVPGDSVIFTGIGFGAGVSSVLFNGVAARIVNVTPSTVVAEVPQGATTGTVTINTPRGSLTTPLSFSIKGIRVSPSSARLLIGESVQFAATVSSQGSDQSVTWSVNGINGGNATVGTISGGGLYTAPRLAAAAIVVRATSVADSTLFGDVQVTVRDPNALQAVIASVSVSRGLSNGATAISSAVSVQHGQAAGTLAASTAPLAVRYGSGDPASAISSSLSVRYGISNGTTTATVPVAVRYGNASGIGAATSAGVSATTGPYVTAIAPNRISPNSTMTLTISGANLLGVTSLMFIAGNGVIDASIAVSNITASADGTSLTATLTLSSGVALGPRVVVVSTATANSLTTDVGSNTIQIVTP